MTSIEARKAVQSVLINNCIVELEDRIADEIVKEVRKSDSSPTSLVAKAALQVSNNYGLIGTNEADRLSDAFAKFAEYLL